MPTRKKATTTKKATITKKATTAKKSTTKAATAKKSTTAKRGDVIVVDSAQVGSPPREGEVLSVIQGEIGVSYRVRWADGHETLLSPKGGVARIIPAGSRG